MSNLLERKNVLKVKKFLKNIDDNFELIVLDKTARTAEDAAKSLKKQVGAIVKSLIFKNIETNEYYLCLVSGDQYMSIEKLSKIIGTKIEKANADECKEVTGFSIGGVSPVAHTHSPSRIFIDEKLNRFDMVYAAAGHPYVVFGITFDNLHTITKGEINSIVE
jgi:prolyl-tRNA editing enzyme YbaK/EbsC (Cys-tRNA(Pro) deacylase)